MKDIYLIPKKENIFHVSTKKLYLTDIYEVYPSVHKESIKDILIRVYEKNEEKYDVIHLGEVIDKIHTKDDKFNVVFLKLEDTIIYFDSKKKDRTKYIRVLVTSLVVFIGSIMGIMNFHADVNMIHSQTNMVSAITNNPDKYLPYFQVPYTIGIGIGVSLFFNKFIPNFSKDEPSPLDLKMTSLNKEIEGSLKLKKK